MQRRGKSFHLLRGGAENHIEKGVDTERSEDFVSLLQTTPLAIGQEDCLQVNAGKTDLG